MRRSVQGATVVTAILAAAQAFAAPKAAEIAVSGLTISAPMVEPAQTIMPAIQLAQTRRSSRSQEQGAAGGLAGRYALLREENKDSGCLVNLMAGGRAQLGPGCRDQGLVVFDPVAWSAGRGTIVLRARKGHRVTFVHKPDGIWVREPPDKRPLALRKF